MDLGRCGVHRRGDSCTSLRSEEGGEANDPGPRPIFFLHGVGLGMVSMPLSLSFFFSPGQISGQRPW